MTKRIKRGGEEPVLLYQPKVLIIDNEIKLCSLFKKILSEEGYNVLIAENEAEAIGLVKKCEPDLVLLDIRMPGIGGLEILRRLKEIKWNIDVIILTGYGTIESARMAMMLGAYDYITKPFNIDYIKLVIKEALNPVYENMRAKMTAEKKEEKLGVKTKRKRRIEDPGSGLVFGEALLDEVHCHSGSVPCMWEVAVRTVVFGNGKCALEWLENPDVPTQEKNALVQLSRVVVSGVKERL